MATDRIPSLFLIGAPKCGTTALSHYLAQHPDIFMSEQAGNKEPRFFCPDLWFPESSNVTTWEAYCSLFRDAPHTTTYLGEASPSYLRSLDAVPEIMQTATDPRFVIMFRDPVELIISLHNQKTKQGLEDRPLHEAWHLQDKRLKNEALPVNVDNGRYMQYADVASLGTQLERFLSHVPRAQAHYIFFEELQRKPEKIYADLMNFLELPLVPPETFNHLNPSVTFRWPVLERFLGHVRYVRTRLGLPGGLGIHKAINKLNTAPGKRDVSDEFRQQLRNYFRSDIRLLAQLTERDLSAWE